MVRLSLVMSVSAMLLAACGESPSPNNATSPEADTPSAVQAPADERAALDGDLVISTNEPFWQARLEGETVVFRRNTEGALEPVPVRTGEVIGDRTVIREGLKTGDTVVVAGAFAVKSKILKAQLGEGHGH